MLKLLTDHAPELLTTVSVPSDSEALRDDIFNPQHWVQTEEHLSVSLCPYGVTDAMLLLKGSYTAAGVKTSALKGDTLKDKIEALYTEAGVKDFVQKCVQPDTGFWFVHDEPNTVLTIPSHFLVVIAGAYAKDGTGSAGLRWGHMSAHSRSQCEQVQSNASQLLKLYPELAATEYGAWQKVLTKYLVPAAV